MASISYKSDIDMNKSQSTTVMLNVTQEMGEDRGGVDMGGGMLKDGKEPTVTLGLRVC